MRNNFILIVLLRSGTLERQTWPEFIEFIQKSQQEIFRNGVATPLFRVWREIGGPPIFGGILGKVLNCESSSSMISNRVSQILSKRDKNTIKILKDVRGAWVLKQLGN